jgi:hypothetical protein
VGDGWERRRGSAALPGDAAADSRGRAVRAPIWWSREFRKKFTRAWRRGCRGTGDQLALSGLEIVVELDADVVVADVVEFEGGIEELEFGIGGAEVFVDDANSEFLADVIAEAGLSLPGGDEVIVAVVMEESRFGEENGTAPTDADEGSQTAGDIVLENGVGKYRNVADPLVIIVFPFVVEKASFQFDGSPTREVESLGDRDAEAHVPLEVALETVAKRLGSLLEEIRTYVEVEVGC